MEAEFYQASTAPILSAIKPVGIPDLYHILNVLLKQRVIGIIVRYGTIDLSVLRFEPGQEEWVDLIIENPQGDQFGELRIRVKGLPPILIYKL